MNEVHITHSTLTKDISSTIYDWKNLFKRQWWASIWRTLFFQQL